MKYATTDQEWSIAIARAYNYQCAWAGCSSTFGLGAHHIVRRANGGLRLLILNGVELCTEHHGVVEAAKGTERYDRMMEILIGKDVYQKLKDLAQEHVQSLTDVPAYDMPTSKEF